MDAEKLGIIIDWLTDEISDLEQDKSATWDFAVQWWLREKRRELNARLLALDGAQKGGQHGE